MTATQVYNLYRGIYGLHDLTTTFNGKPIKLFDAFVIENQTEYETKPIGSLEYCEKTDALRILCKDNKYVYFKSIRIYGKRKITALDFYNGYIKNISLDKRKFIVSCKELENIY